MLLIQRVNDLQTAPAVDPLVGAGSQLDTRSTDRSNLLPGKPNRHGPSSASLQVVMGVRKERVKSIPSVLGPTPHGYLLRGINVARSRGGRTRPKRRTDGVPATRGTQDVSHPQRAVLSAVEDNDEWQPHAPEEFQEVGTVGRIAIGLLGASTAHASALVPGRTGTPTASSTSYLGGGPNVDDADLNRADSDRPDHLDPERHHLRRRRRGLRDLAVARPGQLRGVLPGRPSPQPRLGAGQLVLPRTQPLVSQADRRRRLAGQRSEDAGLRRRPAPAQEAPPHQRVVGAPGSALSCSTW